MATEEGDGGMEDVESSLESERDEGGFMDTLHDLKEKYVDFHTVDEESEDWGDQQAVGDVSRRGFLSLAGQTAVAGYGVAEATDGDGWAVDWSSGNNAAGAGPSPVAGGNGNQTDGQGTPGPSTYGDNQLGVQGDVSDELYLQEDGTVVAIDHGHKEWRAFPSENFPENEDFQSLYNELEGQREETDLAPPSLDSGIEVSQQEIFNHDTAAYDDMADEAEWDLIFDSNPNYSGGN